MRWGCVYHHPVLPKPQIPAPPLNRPFLWGFSLVSFRSFGLWRHFAVSQPDFSLPSLHPKIPFPASGFSTARSRSAAGNFCDMEAKNDVSNPVHNYCGFNPRASNCWLHSAGASRSRSTPIPRGKRPSTAARTRSGARNASEIANGDHSTTHHERSFAGSLAFIGKETSMMVYFENVAVPASSKTRLTPEAIPGPVNLLTLRAYTTVLGDCAVQF